MQVTAPIARTSKEILFEGDRFPQLLERSTIENKSAHGEPVEPVERLELASFRRPMCQTYPGKK
jgi:hypothetical protein